MNRLKRRFQFHFGSINRNQFLYNKEVDDDFSVFVKPVIKDIQKRINFEIVVCEYASVSKSLDYFDRSVFKIMDTHDRFTDRFQIYLNNKVKPGWVSLFIDQERKALKRADLILAVHQKDAEYFASLSGKQTLVYNYVPENAHLNKKTPGKRLLYIASSNEINILTINSFIKNIFPLILKLHPEAKLIIGGDICEKLNVNHDSIFLKEILENLSAFYCSGDIVINPEISGTGYKVKALEALSYGMPLVATTAGAIGGCHPMMDHLFIANSPKEFAITIDNLFCNPSLLETTSKNAVKWIRAKKTEIDSSLALQILNVGKK
jgi:glycosyltransferase involved in cell wall biosynthesis